MTETGSFITYIHEFQIRIICASATITRQHKLRSKLNLPFVYKTQKTFVIRTGHGNVDIVVPRNKPFVTHRAEQRAVIKRIAQIMLTANTIEFD